MTEPGTMAAAPEAGAQSPRADAGRGALLWDVAHLLVSESTPERVLEAVGDALSDLVPYDNLTIYRADLPVRLLRPVVCRDVYAEEIMAAGPLPFGTGISGTAAESGQPALCNDAHLDPRSVQVPGTPEEPESLVAVPLIARGETKGALCLSRLGEGARFSSEEFLLARRFGELAALAIDNAETRARLETEVITDHLTGLFNHRYFQERLSEELRRASRQQSPLALLLYDIDDFKRINDCYGHLTGDQVLEGMASLSREVCRAEDVLCRIGGEEFAVILPGVGPDEAERLAERLRRRIAGTRFRDAGRLTVSVGVATAPDHASSPRDLISRADLALMEVKAAGKDGVRVFSPEAEQERRSRNIADRGELRSIAHMKMLQSLAAKLNRLNDVPEIAELILIELRGLIDYHNCRIHLLDDDGRMLIPIAFRGRLLEYEGETFEALLTEMGEGITGTVAKTGEPMLLANAGDFPGAVQIVGTPDIDESVLCVPLRHGNRVTGTIFLSKLGVRQFDRADLRLVEVLASHAAVALENARLLQVEREAAEISGALLYLSDVLARARDTEEILRESLASIPIMLGCSRASVWMRDPETGSFRAVRHRGYSPDQAASIDGMIVPAEVAQPFVESVTEPFTVSAEALRTLPGQYRLYVDGERSALVAPLRWEPDGFACIVVDSEPGGSFTERQLRLARGIADIASLAVANADRYEELERTYVATVEALANALEASDEYTGDHARALAELSLSVGAEMGLFGEDLKRVQLAALFHDIGKIGVPNEILRKPGPLTGAERREINRHPSIGDQILAPVPFLQPVRPLVRASHERWDGGGYPDRLEREGIPLESRIVFVCDAWHAMTTDRPYRAALPEREAIRRLKLSSGTQFDPVVVEVFIRLHAEGRIPHSHAGNGRVHQPAPS